MKIITSLILCFSLLLPVLSMAAGSCTQAVISTQNPVVKIIRFVCTGAATDGSIPNTDTNATSNSAINGAWLVGVSAYPTTGGTAPDAADVIILDSHGEDYLGSADGGSTANKGANLIHATLKKTALPFSYFSNSNYFFPISGTLTLKVLNQATVNANYTIELLTSR
jgi:hypothetical protein